MEFHRKKERCVYIPYTFPGPLLLFLNLICLRVKKNSLRSHGSASGAEVSIECILLPFNPIYSFSSTLNAHLHRGYALIKPETHEMEKSRLPKKRQKSTWIHTYKIIHSMDIFLLQRRVCSLKIKTKEEVKGFQNSLSVINTMNTVKFILLAIRKGSLACGYFHIYRRWIMLCRSVNIKSGLFHMTAYKLIVP